MRLRANKNGLDWITLSLYLALVLIGWAMIYTVGFGKGYPSGFFDFMATPVGKQLIWVGIAFVVFFVSYTIDSKFWRNWANIIYAVSLLSLVAVLIAGKTIKGATSWFDFGAGITLQPSEFAKFGTCLALASYLGAYAGNLKSLKSKAYALAFFLAPMGLILLQPDAGSALVFLSFFIVLYREGFPGSIFVIGFSAAFLFVLGLVNPPFYIALALAIIGLAVLFWNYFKRRRNTLITIVLLVGLNMAGLYYGLLNWVLVGDAVLLLFFCLLLFFRGKQTFSVLALGSFLMACGLVFAANYAFNNVLKTHQQERIKVWLKPEEADPQGAAYNLNHSKMAIGAGGFLGKGYLEGNLTQGNFVPEQITDFIFSALGEEQGFIGVVVILSLFLLLLWRIVFIAERQRSDFIRLYAYGVASVIFIHFFINISMTMGLLPIIGIPLPFLSKGGSSLLGFTLMIAVLLRLDADRA